MDQTNKQNFSSFLSVVCQFIVLYFFLCSVHLVCYYLHFGACIVCTYFGKAKEVSFFFVRLFIGIVRAFVWKLNQIEDFTFNFWCKTVKLNKTKQKQNSSTTWQWRHQQQQQRRRKGKEVKMNICLLMRHLHLTLRVFWVAILQLHFHFSFVFGFLSFFNIYILRQWDSIFILFPSTSI